MITVITLTRNERYLVPFFLRHYERFVDRIVCYDNCSNDGTPELLAEHSMVEVRHYDTNGLMRDDIHTRLKSDTYRTLNGDWFIITDFDEFVWHPDINKYLERCAGSGATIPSILGYNMIGDVVPEDDGKSLLTDLIQYGVLSAPGPLSYAKPCVVHKDAKMRFFPGCHVYIPEFGQAHTCVRTLESEICLFHYNWLSLEYGLSKRRRTGAQLSPENIKNKLGLQCLNLEGETDSYWSLKTQAVKVI